jgi:hypothetical protein
VFMDFTPGMWRGGEEWEGVGERGREWVRLEGEIGRRVYHRGTRKSFIAFLALAKRSRMAKFSMLLYTGAKPPFSFSLAHIRFFYAGRGWIDSAKRPS